MSVKDQLSDIKEQIELHEAKAELERLQGVRRLYENWGCGNSNFGEPGWLPTPLPDFTKQTGAIRCRTSFSQVYDRADGRYLPYYENEFDLKRIRQQFRNVASFTSTTLGAMEVLTNYVIRGGYEFKVRARDTRKAKDLMQIVDHVQKLVDRLLEVNKFTADLDREIHKDAREDGEKFISIHWEDFPRWQVDEPDEVAEPHNWQDLNRFIRGEGVDFDEQFADWRFGILTSVNESGRHDTASPLGYHMVRDDSGADWDFVPESRMVHFKRNMPRRAKRGISDYFTVIFDVETDGKLARNSGEGMAILAAIPYAREFADASKAPARQPSIPGGDITAITRTGADGTGQSVNKQKYHPGTVPSIYGGKYVPGPMAQMRAEALATVIAFITRRIGTRWNMPEYMISGDASSAPYTATLTIGTPFVIGREADQQVFGNQFVELLWKSLAMLDEQGLISNGVSIAELKSLIEITYDPPDVAITDELKRAQSNEVAIRAGYKSGETSAAETGLDAEQERERGAPMRPQTGTTPPEGSTFGAALQAAVESAESVEDVREIIEAAYP